jgi:hypothetical protein
MDRHRPGVLDVPVDEDAAFAAPVARMPFGEDVLVVGGEVVESEATAVLP